MIKSIRTFGMLLIICVVTLELSACDAAERSMDESMTVQATIIEIEKYGHAVLDITTADFAAAGYELGDIVCVRFGMMEFTMPFYDGYYGNRHRFIQDSNRNEPRERNIFHRGKDGNSRHGMQRKTERRS